MRFVDKTGMRFGRLVVLSGRNIGGSYEWVCQCDCGNRTTVLGTHLHIHNDRGQRSCGCARDGNPTHGMTGTPEYSTWLEMRKRCRNPKSRSYKNYGGRGIKVCRRWDSFENFLADMGPRPSDKHSLDRINNEKNYGPSNCRWATRDQQVRNTRKTIRITYKGKTLLLLDWATLLGIPYRTLIMRYYRKMPVERILQRGRLPRS